MTAAIAAAESPGLTASGVGHWFEGTARLFAGLTFDLVPGTLTAVCGPSGSGKSTLLSILAGWEKPREGEIRRLHVNSVCWVFQNPHGVAGRTAVDHVAFPLLTQGWSRREAEGVARRIMASFELDGVANRPFSALSGGEAQRLMLARAVASAPDLLLVDEPTAQLDSMTARSIESVLANTAASGAMVVIATHDPSVWSLCRNVIDLAGTIPRRGSQ